MWWGVVVALLEEVCHGPGPCTCFDLDVKCITDARTELTNKVHQCCPVKIGTMATMDVFVAVAIICGVRRADVEQWSS